MLTREMGTATIPSGVVIAYPTMVLLSTSCLILVMVTSMISLILFSSMVVRPFRTGVFFLQGAAPAEKFHAQNERRPHQAPQRR